MLFSMGSIELVQIIVLCVLTKHQRAKRTHLHLRSHVINHVLTKIIGGQLLEELATLFVFAIILEISSGFGRAKDGLKGIKHSLAINKKALIKRSIFFCLVIICRGMCSDNRVTSNYFIINKNVVGGWIRGTGLWPQCISDDIIETRSCHSMPLAYNINHLLHRLGHVLEVHFDIINSRLRPAILHLLLTKEGMNSCLVNGADIDGP
jgi:hypothetical protein